MKKISVDWDEDVTLFLADVRMGKRKNMRTLEDAAFYKALMESIELDWSEIEE